MKGGYRTDADGVRRYYNDLGSPAGSDVNRSISSTDQTEMDARRVQADLGRAADVGVARVTKDFQDQNPGATEEDVDRFYYDQRARADRDIASALRQPMVSIGGGQQPGQVAAAAPARTPEQDLAETVRRATLVRQQFDQQEQDRKDRNRKNIEKMAAGMLKQLPQFAPYATRNSTNDNVISAESVASGAMATDVLKYHAFSRYTAQEVANYEKQLAQDPRTRVSSPGLAKYIKAKQDFQSKIEGHFTGLEQVEWSNGKFVGMQAQLDQQKEELKRSRFINSPEMQRLEKEGRQSEIDLRDVSAEYKSREARLQSATHFLQKAKEVSAKLASNEDVSRMSPDIVVGLVVKSGAILNPGVLESFVRANKDYFDQYPGSEQSFRATNERNSKYPSMSPDELVDYAETVVPMQASGQSASAGTAGTSSLRAVTDYVTNAMLNGFSVIDAISNGFMLTGDDQAGLNPAYREAANEGVRNATRVNPSLTDAMRSGVQDSFRTYDAVAPEFSKNMGDATKTSADSVAYSLSVANKSGDVAALEGRRILGMSDDEIRERYKAKLVGFLEDNGMRSDRAAMVMNDRMSDMGSPERIQMEATVSRIAQKREEVKGNDSMAAGNNIKVLFDTFPSLQNVLDIMSVKNGSETLYIALPKGDKVLADKIGEAFNDAVNSGRAKEFIAMAGSRNLAGVDVVGTKADYNKISTMYWGEIKPNPLWDADTQKVYADRLSKESNPLMVELYKNASDPEAIKTTLHTWLKSGWDERPEYSLTKDKAAKAYLENYATALKPILAPVSTLGQATEKGVSPKDKATEASLASLSRWNPDARGVAHGTEPGSSEMASSSFAKGDTAGKQIADIIKGNDELMAYWKTGTESGKTLAFAKAMALAIDQERAKLYDRGGMLGSYVQLADIAGFLSGSTRTAEGWEINLDRTQDEWANDYQLERGQVSNVLESIAKSEYRLAQFLSFPQYSDRPARDWIMMESTKQAYRTILDARSKYAEIRSAQARLGASPGVAGQKMPNVM